jgi:hypothetical protein
VTVGSSGSGLLLSQSQAVLAEAAAAGSAYAHHYHSQQQQQQQYHAQTISLERTGLGGALAAATAGSRALLLPSLSMTALSTAHSLASLHGHGGHGYGHTGHGFSGEALLLRPSASAVALAPVVAAARTVPLAALPVPQGAGIGLRSGVGTKAGAIAAAAPLASVTSNADLRGTYSYMLTTRTKVQFVYSLFILTLPPRPLFYRPRLAGICG